MNKFKLIIYLRFFPFQQLYPSNCPDAVTKITVWKRYNDFKKLHREMKALYKKLCMTDTFPVLPHTSFFRRFDEEVVEERRHSALNFLEYLGQHFQLFTSREFIKFFEVGFNYYYCFFNKFGVNCL